MTETLRFYADGLGRRLDEALRERLPGFPSRSRVRAMIVGGAVRVGRHVVRNPALVLHAGSLVTAEVPPPEAAVPPPTFGPDRVLYEDADLLAVDKPPGLAMHANVDPGRLHLVGLVTDWLRSRDGGQPYLGIHQRLDRDTSGVVLFARDRRANPGLARTFEGREARKTYHALTGRPRDLPPPAWTETRPLAPPARKGGPVLVSPEGDPAETAFRRLQVNPRGLLVEASPRTGRKHQVRAHLAAAGLPILGDALYGGSRSVGGLAVGRTMLHAFRLELPHPVTGAPLALECPYPEDFRAALAAQGG